MKSIDLTEELLTQIDNLQEQIALDLSDNDVIKSMQADLAETEKTLKAIKKTLFIMDMGKLS